MARPGSIQWKAQRYVLRPDVVRKVRHRYDRYRRRAEREAYGDVVHATRALDAPTVVVDVGANIGLVTSTLLRSFPEAVVHAFEPTPETFDVLRQRLEDEPRAVLNQLAVSDAVGTTTFNVDNRTHAGGSNSLLAHSASFATRARVDRYQPIEVATTTLDAYAEEHGLDHVDLVKLDIEGAELMALRGAAGLLARQAVDFVVSEVRFVADYEGQPLLAELVEHMAGVGYTLFNLYAPAESALRQALFGDATFVSEAMRRRLHETYGEQVCGWHQPPP